PAAGGLRLGRRLGVGLVAGLALERAAGGRAGEGDDVVGEAGVRRLGGRFRRGEGLGRSEGLRRGRRLGLGAQLGAGGDRVAQARGGDLDRVARRGRRRARLPRLRRLCRQRGEGGLLGGSAERLLGAGRGRNRGAGRRAQRGRRSGLGARLRGRGGGLGGRLA